MFGPICWTHLGGKRDTLVTRWQYGFFLWVEGIPGEWNGLISQENNPRRWKHASTDVNAIGGIDLLQTGRSQRVMEGIGLLHNRHWKLFRCLWVGCNSLIVWQAPCTDQTQRLPLHEATPRLYRQSRKLPVRRG